MKKFLAFIICLLLILSASACTVSDTQSNDSSLQSSGENELDRNLLRALTGTNDVSKIKSLRIFHDNNLLTTAITNSKDWAFLEKYVYCYSVSYEEKEKLISGTKTNTIRIGTSDGTIYLLNDGSIIIPEMCGDSGVKTEDRDFEIYKADKKYILDEKALNKLLEKYDTEVVQFQTGGNVSSNKNTSSKKDTVTSSDKSSISKKEPTSQGTTTVTKGELPKVELLNKNHDVVLNDILKLANGGFIVVGNRYTEDNGYSIIQQFDKNYNFVSEYTYAEYGEFKKVAACSDGGFIIALEVNPYITKINSKFELEWQRVYEDITLDGNIRDMKEINPNCYAVLYTSAPFDKSTLKTSFLDKNGNPIDKLEFLDYNLPFDAKILLDGDGGFYVVSACDEMLVEKHPMVAESYVEEKGKEVAIMHFSADRKLKDAKTIGGNGDDWVEEATIDSEGNLHIVLGTNSPRKDDFWQMNFEDGYLYRRMLVKLDKNGKIVYKLPISADGMAVDQTFGMHIKDGKTYIVGMANYFDGYQNKYPCEQIFEYEKNDRVFCVFAICIDKNGKELYRNIFWCDINDEPCGFALLPNGSLVIAGSVSLNDNPFGVDFALDEGRRAALFIYK